MNKKDAKDKIRIRRQKEMKRKTGICLMIILLMIVSTFSVVTANSNSSCEPGIVTFEKTIWNKDTQGWDDCLHDVIIGDTVHFKLTINYAEAGYYDGVKLSLKNINIFDVLPYGLEYVDGSSTVDGTPIVPEISGSTLHWNLTDASYNLDENESHNIEFIALVVYSENVEYTKPETDIDNYAYATAWECGHIYYHGADELNGCANVYVKNKIEVKKEVKNGNEWVDSVDNVILGQILTFKITITYYGPYVLDNMNVTDHLPSCLEYADNTIITGAENVIPTVEEGKVTWCWAKDLNLGNGGTVTITFDTKVVKYCEEEDGGEVNSVCVRAESFCHEVYRGHAEIPVNCIPHDPIFEKTVFNGQRWDEKTNVYVDDTVRFKIELTYYGNENLTDIKIVDELPCVLKYVGNEKVKIVRSVDQSIEILEINDTVSGDKKTIWWNLTNELSDRDTLSIEFDALVTGITGDCGDCGINTASYTGNDYSGSDTAQISSTHKPPPPPAKLTITIKRFSIGHIQANIENVGETGVSFVKWSMTTKGGILKKINATAGGTLSEINAGSSRSISSGKRSIKHGFGRITITITVTVGEEPFEKKADGFVIGRLIIVR
jgi:fimbrial isopeptide formation D2 family protein